MLKIDGRRIFLRDHVESDLDAYCDWISDDSVMEHLTWKAADRQIAERRLLDAIADSRSDQRSKFFFAIVQKETGEMIGDVGFTVICTGDRGGVADLGYFLRKKFHGQGYGLESSRLAIRHAFEGLGLHKVVASCAADNHKSERLMKKIGMKKEGHFSSEYFHKGEWRDRVRYAILEPEWKLLARADR